MNVEDREGLLKEASTAHHRNQCMIHFFHMSWDELIPLDLYYLEESKIWVADYSQHQYQIKSPRFALHPVQYP